MTFASPVATAEFSKFAGMLSAGALSADGQACSQTGAGAPRPLVHPLSPPLVSAAGHKPVPPQVHLSPLCLSASGLPEGSEPTYLQTGGSQQQSVRGRALAALNQWDVGNVINDPVFWVGSSGGTFCVLLRSFSRMDPPTTVSNNYMSVSSFLTCPSQISPPTLWDRFCNKSLHPKLCLRPCSQGHSN